MKKFPGLLGFCLILLALSGTEVNPLWQWEPYRIWINDILHSFPRLFFGTVLFLFFVGAGILVYDEIRDLAR